MKSLIIGALAALAASHAVAQAYDFRGATLGMTLEAWRALPPPQQLLSPSEIRCADQAGSYLFQSEPFAPGLIGCTYADPKYGGWIGQRVGAAGEITSVGYYFVEGRLYRISLMATDASLTAIQSGLAERFGRPTTVESSEFQTRAGAKFPQITLTWHRAGGTIRLQAPDFRADRLTVNYTDDKGQERADSLVRGLNPEGAKM